MKCIGVSPVYPFGESQEGNGAYEVDLGFDPLGFCLFVFIDDFFTVETVLVLKAEFGDDIVVVGVEPLGHLHRDTLFVPSSHSKIARFILQCLKSFWDGTQHHRCIQHRIIKAEVV